MARANAARSTSSRYSRATLRRSSRPVPANSSPSATLSSTVRQGSREYSWNTMPTSRRGTFTGWPRYRISPSLTGSSPAAMRKNVDLPQPLGPTMQMNSFSCTSRSNSFRASISPSRKRKRLRTLRAESTVSVIRAYRENCFQAYLRRSIHWKAISSRAPTTLMLIMPAMTTSVRPTV